jgi:hypothetical protein
MRYAIFAFAILTSAVLPAQAQDNPAPKRNPYTNEQINAVLESRGIPPLGGGRVLFDPKARESKSEIKSVTTFINR